MLGDEGVKIMLAENRLFAIIIMLIYLSISQ